jgi:hypothetical protein
MRVEGTETGRWFKCFSVVSAYCESFTRNRSILSLVVLFHTFVLLYQLLMPYRCHDNY